MAKPWEWLNKYLAGQEKIVGVEGTGSEATAGLFGKGEHMVQADY